MLIPKKEQHRKWHKGRGRNRAHLATTRMNVDFGDFGLKAMTAGWIDSRQIEAARRAITRYVKRGGKVWIRIFPDKPVTSKGSQTTMGGGKGGPEKHVAVVYPGTMIFEMAGISESIAKEAFRLAAHKLPVKTKFIAKQ
jgi:large subunit ribosomal protein L16